MTTPKRCGRSRLRDRSINRSIKGYQEPAQRLRFFSAAGELLPTPEESALQAEAELARVQANRQQLADKLRELGIDPDALE